MSWGEGPKKVTYLEWHYIDIQYFVKNLWNVEWEGGAAMGFPSQDTYLDYDVTGVSSEPMEWINAKGKEIRAYVIGENTYSEAKQIIKKFRAEGMPREEYAEPGLELLLNWLCHEGVIPAGSYRILVWW